MNKLFKYCLLFAAIILAGVVASCSDDKEVDHYTLNYVYMYQPQSTFTSIQYKATGDFLTDIENEVALMPVRCTKPATSDMTVEVAVDASLVDEYNAKHGTDYVFLQSAKVVKSSYTISKGEYIAKTTADGVVVEDTVKVTFTDLAEFQNGSTNYIVPVTVTSANAGGTIAKSGCIFLLFNSEYIANKVSGVAVKVSVDGEAEGWQEAFNAFELADFMIASWNADEEITANVEISQAYVESYNLLNGTDYVFMEGAKLKSNKVTIKKGSLTAEALGIELADLTSVAQGDIVYILPIVISNVTGNGAELNEEKKVAYITFAKALPDLSFSSTAPQGSDRLTADKDWSCLIWGESTDLLNGVPYYWIYSGDDIVIDMASEQSIDAVLIYPYGGNSTYQFKNVTVSISSDGVNYTELGEMYIQKVSNAYINFTPAAKARYIKILMNSSYYSYSYYYLSALGGIYLYSR
jgi:hypothetical protein